MLLIVQTSTQRLGVNERRIPPGHCHWNYRYSDLKITRHSRLIVTTDLVFQISDKLGCRMANKVPSMFLNLTTITCNRISSVYRPANRFLISVWTIETCRRAVRADVSLRIDQAGNNVKMSQSLRYRRDKGTAVQFAPYNAIINHLPTMILFAASGPGVTYRDAPRTVGRRYITAICNIALGCTKKENRRELSRQRRVPAIAPSPWAVSIDLPARATFKPWKHSCRTLRQQETTKEDWSLARIVLPWFMHFLSAPRVAAHRFTVDAWFLTERAGRNRDVDKSRQFF